MLGNISMQSDNLAQAEAAYREALRLDPDLGEAHQYLGNLLGLLGRNDEAVVSYRQALHIKPHSIPAHINLANTLANQGRFGEAQEVYRSALQYDPDNRKAILGIAHTYERQGKAREAFEQLQPYLHPEKVDADAAMIFAALCRPLQRCDEAVALMEGLLARQDPPLNDMARSTLYFRLGRLRDTNDEYDLAFHSYKCANDIKAGQWKFDTQAHIRHVDALISTFSKTFLDTAPRATLGSQRPVFIVGMPRSGTTLVEQILGSHPAVFAGGELEDMTRIALDLPALLGGGTPYPQCVTHLTPSHCNRLAQRYLDRLTALSPTATRVTDKMPDNFLRLGLIAMLFPEARIIHCLRDPLDTCLSCYFQNFGPPLSFSYELPALAIYYRQYRRLMDHWRTVLQLPLLEIRYEELVADQERITRAMVDFCGLEWDDRCLRFHESERVAGTASYAQVRQPLYSRSVGRWRHYARHLTPLEELVTEFR